MSFVFVAITLCDFCAAPGISCVVLLAVDFYWVREEAALRSSDGEGDFGQ